MSKIATYISKLSPQARPAHAERLITMGTNNPLVPGNGPVLAELTTVNNALAAANAEIAVLAQQLKEKYTARNLLSAQWATKVNALAGFTFMATGGDAVAIESAGFSLVPAPQPPQPLHAPQNLRVATNGAPGVSKVTWDAEATAASFALQSSPDPITPTSWSETIVCTKASHEAAGAEPGKVCWFRVAGVNALGQGPWSLPVQRPVV